MRYLKFRFIPLTLLALAFLPLNAQAEALPEDPVEKGLAIATEANRRDNGFQDLTAHLEMTLYNRHGQNTTRRVRVRTLETEDDGDKSLTIFDQPRDVKGTALLTFSHKVKSDDQWLFLPALKRVKRISSANKSGSFMGSEFAYEDISSEEVEKYTYRWLRDEDYEGKSCFVIERDPVDPNSGYTRQVAWIDKTEYRLLKVDYFDRKKSLLKTLLFKQYHQYLDHYWRAEIMEMSNHQSGKHTTLHWKDYQFRVGLKDKDFTKNSLKRAR